MDRLSEYVIKHSSCCMPRCEYVENDIEIDCDKCQEIMFAEHDKQVRVDAIDDCIQWIVSKFSYIDELNVARIRCNASTIEINMKEQLMQKGAENGNT